MHNKLIELSKTELSTSSWQKATIIGSVWGAFEIVAGSILHNFAIPTVAGIVLSALGVFVMVSGARVFGGKGIFWRSALVCAALKTVSPSPVILSPMIGITLEGFLMEFGVLALGQNIAGFILGGGLALLSVLGFKLVRLIMIYGSDIVTAYQSVFTLSFSDNFLQSNGYLLPILLLTLFFVAIGAMAAYSGYFGGNTIKERFEGQSIMLLPTDNSYKPKVVHGYKGGIGFLLFHIIWLTVFVTLKGIIPTYYWLWGGVIYILLSVFRYGRIRKLISRPTFWIVILSVSLISTFFIQIGKNGSLTFNQDFLIYSFTIFLRATVVIIAFACINIELKSKGVSRHFQNSMFTPLANSYAQAHEALPSLISTFKQERHRILKPLPIVELMYSHFTNSNQTNQQHIFIISAERMGGKTTFMMKVIELLKNSGIEFNGFVAEGLVDESGKRIGFNLLNVKTNSSIPLCDKVSTQWEQYGSYFFNPKAVEEGNRILSEVKENEIVFIDEIGIFELEGKLWANAFTKLLSKSNNQLVVSVRKDFLKPISDKWNLSNPKVIDVNRTNPTELVLLLTAENE